MLRLSEEAARVARSDAIDRQPPVRQLWGNNVGRVKPTCLALVLCESIVRKHGTGEPDIRNAFEFFELPKASGEAPPFTVWMQFRDGSGKTAMRLVVEYLPNDTPEAEEIVAAPFTLDFADPNIVREHEARFDAGLPLRREGRYRLSVTADDTTIMQRYFGVFRDAK